MKNKDIRLIVIGGSWGGIQAAVQILHSLPADFQIPIVLILHRLRNQESELHRIFDKKLLLKVREIEEKEVLKPGFVYLAPANYHVLLENDMSFALDSSELENYSRPAIDVTFKSAASVMGDQLVGILLSGASKDGSRGLQAIAKNGGAVLIQDPKEAEAKTMPTAAIRILSKARVLRLNEIQTYLLSLHDCQQTAG